MSSASTQWAEVGVVLEAGAGLPVGPPGREAAQAGVPVLPLQRGERGPGEAAGVGQDLLDGDGVLAVGPELGDVLGDPVLQAQLPLAQEEPDGAGDDDLARRVAVEATARPGRRRWPRPRARRRGRRPADRPAGCRHRRPAEPGRRDRRVGPGPRSSRCSSAADATVRRGAHPGDRWDGIHRLVRHGGPHRGGPRRPAAGSGPGEGGRGLRPAPGRSGGGREGRHHRRRLGRRRAGRLCRGAARRRRRRREPPPGRRGPGHQRQRHPQRGRGGGPGRTGPDRPHVVGQRVVLGGPPSGHPRHPGGRSGQRLRASPRPRPSSTCADCRTRARR